MDTDTSLTRLDPGYRKLQRLEGAFLAGPLLIGALVLTFVPDVPFWLRILAWIVAAIIAIITVLYLPHRRYVTRGYSMALDRLRVVRGVLFHFDTVVPFSRVQHIDLQQGPLERLFGIARLILYTAGTHNASVVLPGLAHDDAIAMRESIRRHVRQESV